MRKAMAVFMALMLLGSITTPLFAGPMDTLKSGVTDIVTAPMELPNHMVEETKAATFKPFGLQGGVLKGSFYTVYKLGSGVVDIVTIPLHLHE